MLLEPQVDRRLTSHSVIAEVSGDEARYIYIYIYIYIFFFFFL